MYLLPFLVTVKYESMTIYFVVYYSGESSHRRACRSDWGHSLHRDQSQVEVTSGVLGLCGLFIVCWGSRNICSYVPKQFHIIVEVKHLSVTTTCIGRVIFQKYTHSGYCVSQNALKIETHEYYETTWLLQCKDIWIIHF